MCHLNFKSQHVHSMSLLGCWRPRTRTPNPADGHRPSTRGSASPRGSSTRCGRSATSSTPKAPRRPARGGAEPGAERRRGRIDPRVVGRINEADAQTQIITAKMEDGCFQSKRTACTAVGASSWGELGALSLYTEEQLNMHPHVDRLSAKIATDMKDCTIPTTPKEFEQDKSAMMSRFRG